MSEDYMHPDLFGGETPMAEPALSPYQKRKKQLQYRKADKDSDERCKNCEHCIRISYHGKNYYKCELIGMSHSEATDIRLSYTCNQFKHHENTDED